MSRQALRIRRSKLISLTNRLKSKKAEGQSHMSSFKELANNGISGLMVYEPGRPIDEVARELGFNDPAEITKLASNENSL
jgi:hypothetical protein